MPVNLTVGVYKSQMDRPDVSARTRNTSAVRTARQQTCGSAASSAGDKVSVSSDALLRTEAYKAASAAPDVRRDKVDEIRERLAAGDYHIDNRRIAARLVESELALFL